MDIEARNVIAEMENATEEKLAGCVYTAGKLYGRDAVVCVCGIGKVNAAVCAQEMITRYAPDEVINVGVAGSLTPDLKVFDVVVSRDLCQHDFDLEPFGRPAGFIPGLDRTFFEASDKIIARLEKALKAENVNYRVGRIASGDQFIDTDEARRRIADKYGADACEMEGCAVAQTCCLNGVEFAVLRAISDSGEGDYAKFAARAADNSARVICRYMRDR